MKDSKGVVKNRSELWGLTVEISGQNFYFRDGLEACDDSMEKMMVHTSMATQLARIEGGKNGV